MEPQDVAVLIGSCACVAVSGYTAWRIGVWLGEYTIRRWYKRHLTGE